MRRLAGARYADRVAGWGVEDWGRRRVGQLLGLNPATLRNWVEAAEKASRPVEPSGLSLADDNARLRKENFELRRRANECRRSRSATTAPAASSPATRHTAEQPIRKPKARQGGKGRRGGSHSSECDPPRPLGESLLCGSLVNDNRARDRQAIIQRGGSSLPG